MAFVKQILNGFPCAVYVIRAYTVCLDLLQEPVDQNEGETVQREPQNRIVVGLVFNRKMIMPSTPCLRKDEMTLDSLAGIRA